MLSSNFDHLLYHLGEIISVCLSFLGFFFLRFVRLIGSSLYFPENNNDLLLRVDVRKLTHRKHLKQCVAYTLIVTYHYHHQEFWDCKGTDCVLWPVNHLNGIFNLYWGITSEYTEISWGQIMEVLSSVLRNN